jgi:YHS domain-containing protein
MKKNLNYIAVFAAVLLVSCSSEKAPQTQAAATPEPSTEMPSANHASHMAAAGTQAQQTADPSELMTGDGLPKDLVCMVNNAYMGGKKQFPVPFEEKMYYGCCEMCVKTIKNEREVRYAKDPVTGQEIDKAEAFIALKPGGANGDVLYFASEENYKKYVQ